MSWFGKATKAVFDFLPRTFHLTDPSLARIVEGGRDTSSGKIVTVDTSLNLSAVWACVHLISQAIASLPLIVYRETVAGKQVAFNHPLYSLLHDQPNADMTSVEFWEAMISCVLLMGNAYAKKEVNGLGQVIALTPLAPDRMNVRRNPDGSLLYIFSPWRQGFSGGRAEELTEDEVFHIKGWSLNGLLGLSPIAYARQSFGIAIAADESAGKFFANGLNLSGFVSTGGEVLTDAQRERFKARLDDLRGSRQSGSTMLLEGPFTYNSLSMTPDDAQLLASRQFAIEEICRWFKVPPHMVGHTANSTSWGTGLEQQMMGFLTFTLAPWIQRIEKRILHSLVLPRDKGVIYAKFNVDGLLRADSASRSALYASAVQNGWMTRNEVRGLEDNPPVEGGDKSTVQINLTTLDKVGEAAPLQTSLDKNNKPVAIDAQPVVRQ